MAHKASNAKDAANGSAAFTEEDMDVLAWLRKLHSQKVTDYTEAVPNAGLARMHGKAVDALAKATAILRGEGATCECCVRKPKEWREPLKMCDGCVRRKGLKDLYKRSVTATVEAPY